MAKEQKLTLNPAKISGICDRLMCCLRYEYATYRDARACFPRIKSMVDTPKGPARVLDYNVMTSEVFVELESEERMCFKVSDLRRLQGEHGPAGRPCPMDADSDMDPNADLDADQDEMGDNL
jgi:hypothetical protein